MPDPRPAAADVSPGHYPGPPVERGHWRLEPEGLDRTIRAEQID